MSSTRDISAPTAWKIYQIIAGADTMWKLPLDAVMRLYDLLQPQSATPIGCWFEILGQVQQVVESIAPFCKESTGSDDGDPVDRRVGPDAPLFAGLILERYASWTEIQQMTLPEILAMHDAISERHALREQARAASAPRSTPSGTSDPFTVLQQWRDWKDSQEP